MKRVKNSTQMHPAGFAPLNQPLCFKAYGILLALFALFTSHATAQEKISLDLTNQPLSMVLEQIETQTSYNYIFNNDEVDIDQKVSIEVKEESLKKILDLLSQKTDLRIRVVKKHIILSARKIKADQNKYTIGGTIKEAETGETLIGATIRKKGTTQGSITNAYGFYSLTLPQGKHALEFSYVGYEPVVVELNVDQNRNLDIELNYSSNELKEVVITDNSNNQSRVNSVLTGISHLRSDDVKQMPALLGEPDINRAMLTLPGVSSIGEGTSGFNVRGGNLDQNLILLDEAPVYNSSHVWGFFSIFNADAIKDIKIYKGGIPARYGGRASSVLEIRQREGSNKKFQGEGGLGLLFSRLTLEGPLKKEKVSFLLSGRRSYFDIFFPLMGEEMKGNRVFFYDLNSKLTWNINEKNKLFASGYFGADVMSIEQSESDEKIDFRWKNATATLRWNHIFSSKLFMNVSGIYSRYNYALASENDTGGGPAGTSGSFEWKATIENWIFKPDLTFFQNNTTQIRFGVNATLYKFTPAEVISKEVGINDVNFEVERGIELAPYLEYDKQWNRFSLNAGLRYSWFGNVGPHTLVEYNPNFPKTVNTVTGSKRYGRGDIIESYSGLEPRLSLKYSLNEFQALKIGYNRMFQYIQLISNTNAALPFDIWKLSGAHLDPLEVNQYTLGYAYDTHTGTYNFSVEGYYKTFKNVVEYINGADLFLNNNLETQLLPADAYSYGIEFAAYKNLGRWTGNANYTYSVTRRKTTSPFTTVNINNGDYYPSNYDRPHIFNLTANYKLGKKWDLGLFFTFQTGRPYTQPNGRFTYEGTPYLTYSSRNANRIPNTHRMDISFTYRPDKPHRKWESSWNFGLYNLYGNNNAFSVYSTFTDSLVRTFKFSVIGAPIPFVTYNFKF